MLFLGAATVVAAAAPSSANAAAAWRCDASAVSGTVLNGTVALPTVKVNPGALDCLTKSVGSGIKLPAPLDSAALVAQTSVSGAADNPAVQKVMAVGGIADLKVKALPELPIDLPEATIPAELSSFQVDLSAIPDPGNLLPSALTLDLKPALDALNPQRLLNGVDILRVQGAVAYASAGCVNGVPKLAGASQVAGINVLGTDLPVGQVVDQAVSLLDSGAIDPSNIDLTKVALPAGLSWDMPLVGTLLTDTVKTALDALPTISIPAALAQVKVTPGEQTNVGGLLTQTALRVQVGILGQSIVDTVVGAASVGAGAVNCAPELACTSKALTLVDVYEKNNRVKLLGVAHRKYAGQMVDIVFEATGKVVARAKVGPDGKFDTDTALPAKRLRGTNEARYMAVIGKEKSMNLKLARRMIVDQMVARDGKVVISGRVVGPMARGKDREILVTRRVSCTKMEKVGTFKPESDGTFSISFDAPTNQSTAVYRLSTQVLKNGKAFPTYTLPRAVNLLGT